MSGQGNSEDIRAGVRRRELLLGGAGALAATASGGLINPSLASADASAGSSPNGDPEGPSVNGTLSEVRAGDTLVLIKGHLDLPDPPAGASAPDAAEIPVKVVKDTELWRTGPAELTDFRSGDKLLAYVDWEEGELVARAVVPLYSSVEATVESVDGDRLQTSAGTVVINQYTRGALPEVPVGEISKGDRIGATCMQDVSSGVFYAGNLVVLS